MAGNPQSSVPVDPISGISTLSLFPRTFRLSAADLKSVADGIDVIHSHIKAMELRSPKRLLEQAKTILDSGTGFGSTGIMGTANAFLKIHVDKNEVIIAKGIENPHQKRPSLGRKRAQFSLLPNASEPFGSFKAGLNIDIFEDPEEYFSEMEKLEKAEKEIRRQRGIPMTELDHNAPLVNARRRRPSLLGKSASYKHRCSTGSINDENPHLQSQEASIQVLSSPSGDIMPPETADPGLTAIVEDQVSKIFDELLSGNDEELGEDETLNLLQERLNIKPLNMSKICLPGLHNVRKSLPESSGEALQIIGHEPSYRHDMMITRRSSIESNPKMERAFSQASPRPAKGPLASLSLLKRRMSKFDPTKDRLSAFDVDPSHEQTDQQSHQIDIHVKVRDCERLVHENEGMRVASEESQDLIAGNSASSDTCVEDMPRVACSSLNGNHVMDMDPGMIETNIIGSGGFDDEALGHLSKLAAQAPEDEVLRLNVDVQKPAVQKLDGCMKAPSSVIVNEEMRNVPSMSLCRSDELSIEKNEASKVKSNRGKTKGPSGGHSSKAVHGKTESEAGQHGKRRRKEHFHGQSLNGSTDAVIDHLMEELPSMQGNDHQQSTDIWKETAPLQKQTSNMTVDKGVERNVAAKVRRKRKEHDRKKSLAAAGTKWESGVRRSTRIKTRPLEYWKGERLLYGRIHNSMVTLIGLKYFSPSKDGGLPSVRVKSYVSDEYKSLVDLAALH
ncbi:hypothetical protein Dimus_027783 [Dionaea muscipula]